MREGYTAYNVEVRTSTIIEGDLIYGNDHLSCVFMKYKNEDEEIHGYFQQMVESALSELDELIQIHLA